MKKYLRICLGSSTIKNWFIINILVYIYISWQQYLVSTWKKACMCVMGNLFQPIIFKRWDQVRVWLFGTPQKMVCGIGVLSQCVVSWQHIRPYKYYRIFKIFGHLKIVLECGYGNSLSTFHVVIPGISGCEADPLARTDCSGDVEQ